LLDLAKGCYRKKRERIKVSPMRFSGEVTPTPFAFKGEGNAKRPKCCPEYPTLLFAHGKNRREACVFNTG